MPAPEEAPPEVTLETSMGSFTVEGDFAIDYTSYIADNIYKLARLGVHGLSKEMRVPEQVVQNGVNEYFQKEPTTRSKEVSHILRGLKGSKETKGNKDSIRKQKDLYQLEYHLFETIQFMNWTQKLSLEDISSKYGVTKELQQYYIMLFIEFRKYLGYGDGIDEVCDDKPKTIPEPKEQISDNFGVGGEVQSLQGPKPTNQSSSKKGKSATRNPGSEKKSEAREQKSRKSKKCAPPTQPADAQFGGEASFQREPLSPTNQPQSSRKEHVDTTVFVTGNSLRDAKSVHLRLAFKEFGAIKPGGIHVKNEGPNPYAFIDYVHHDSKQKAIKASKLPFRGVEVEIKEKRPNKESIGTSSNSFREPQVDDSLQHYLSKSSDGFGPDRTTSDKLFEESLKEEEIIDWEKKMAEVEDDVIWEHRLAFDRLKYAGNVTQIKTAGKEIFGTLIDFPVPIAPDDIIDLLTRRWLDINLVTWFTMSLKKSLENKNSNKCDFMAPFMVYDGMCIKDPALVQH